MTGAEQAHEVTTTTSPQRFSRGWHAVLAIVVTASFAGQLYLLAHGETDLSASGDQGVSVAVRLGRLVSYFTIESNLLVLAAAVSLVLDPGRDGRLWRVLRLDALTSRRGGRWRGGCSSAVARWDDDRERHPRRAG